MIGLLLAMYPAQWRRRYGEEFRAVLESRPLGPFDVADVLLGALDARSRVLRIAGSPEPTGGRFTMLRLGGLGAIAGGALWVAGFVGGNMNPDNSTWWFGLLAAGTAAILVALIGLSAFQAHRDPRLAWAAFLIPGAGAVISLVGLYGMFTQPSDFPMLFGWGPWSIWMVGILAMVIGSALFGVATLQAQVLSRRAALALVASSVMFLVVALLGFGGNITNVPAEVLIGGCIAAFGGSWAWLGLSALRSGPIRAVAPA